MNVKAKSTKLLSALLSLLLILTLSPFATATAWGDVLPDLGGGYNPSDTTTTDTSTTTTTTSTNSTGVYTISVNSASAREYSVYQIFTGDCSGNILTNVKWGSNAQNYGSNDEAISVTAGDKVSDDVLTALEELASSEKTDLEKLEIIKKYVDFTSTPVATVDNNTTYEAQSGYYLILESTKDISLENEFAVTILDSDVQISPKEGEQPLVTSDINVKNSSSDSVYAKSAVVNRNSIDLIKPITYVQLKATISDAKDGYSAFDSFKLKLENTLGTGFTTTISTLNNYSKVYVGDEQISSGYKFEYDSSSNKITVIFDNLKNIESVKAGSVITVEYFVSMLSSAIVLNGQSNCVSLTAEYPSGISTKSTVSSSAYVYSYQLKMSSQDNSGNALTGATFVLQKKTEAATEDTEAQYTNISDSSFTLDTSGIAKFNSLTAGDYRLVETAAPTGYNTIDPIEFTVSITESEGVATIAATSENASFTSESGNGGYTGVVSVAIQHSQGANLPMPLSGGLGTSLFYLIGAGCLVAGCMALVVYRRRRLS